MHATRPPECFDRRRPQGNLTQASPRWSSVRASGQGASRRSHRVDERNVARFAAEFIVWAESIEPLKKIVQIILQALVSPVRADRPDPIRTRAVRTGRRNFFGSVVEAAYVRLDQAQSPPRKANPRLRLSHGAAYGLHRTGQARSIQRLPPAECKRKAPDTEGRQPGANLGDRCSA